MAVWCSGDWGQWLSFQSARHEVKAWGEVKRESNGTILDHFSFCVGGASSTTCVCVCVVFVCMRMWKCISMCVCVCVCVEYVYVALAVRVSAHGGAHHPR